MSQCSDCATVLSQRDAARAENVRLRQLVTNLEKKLRIRKANP